MFVLVGVTEAHYPEESDSEEKLALFTTEDKARKYELACRLKSYSDFCGRGQHFKQYRAKTLLRGCCHAYVEEYDEESLPVDPEIKDAIH